jgi:crotonobetainyl-CoA:carnitine CoA-transferase CaiB-like acyl-CoA transferase
MGSPGAVRGPRRLPDADRAEILAELAASPSPTPPPCAVEEQTGHLAPPPPHEGEGAGGKGMLSSPLDGLRVLDLTQVLAGPTGGRLLADFGAEVIKINGPQRRIGSHGYLNRGKRTILLDVESTEGQQVFWKLVERADVVIQNFPKGTAERYGIGYDQVRARKPDIVYASLSVHGHHGPWAHARGYERQGQAVTGVMERVGDVPAILGPYNLVDIGTGVMTAFAVGLGLYHRQRTGEGQHVQSSLSQTATYHQTPYMLDYAGKVRDEPRGWTALGTGPLQRFYRAQDGWFFLGARSSQVGRVAAAVGIKNAASLEACDLEKALEARFGGQPVAAWVDRLRAAGVSAQAVVSVQALMVDPWVREHGLSVSQCSEEVGDVTYPGPSVQMSDTPVRLGPPVRQPGADGPAVLAEVGLGDAVESLERQWALQVTNLPQGW